MNTLINRMASGLFCLLATLTALPAWAAPSATTDAATSITASAATLNATVTADGVNAVNNIQFEYGTTTGYGTTVAASVTSAATGVTVNPTAALTGLNCGTLYHFRVVATDAAPSTTNGNDLTFNTSLCPQTITFNNPGDKLFGTTPTVSAAATSGLTVAFTSATTGVCTVAGTTLTLVSNGTCTLNANQAGDATYAAAPQVSQSFNVANVPGAPTIGTATAGDTQASVAFTAPVSNGGAAITSYTASASPGALTGSCAASPCTVSGLTNGTAYTFTVTATNSVGTGTASAASNAATPLGAQTIAFANPGAQNFGTTPTLTATASSSLTVTFSSNTTSVCTISSGGTLTFAAAGTCTIQADQAGNASYLAAPAVTQSFTVNAVAPAAPTAPYAIAGYQQATVSFTPPTNTGGSPITGYTVTSNPVGGVDSNAGGSSTSHIITGLTNGTGYTFTVKASNSAGPSPASTASNAVTPAVAPPDPPINVVATRGDTQVTITFDAPLSDGGSPITLYTATANSGGFVKSCSGPAACTIVVTGLTNGTNYQFMLTATNAAGTSATYTLSNWAKPARVPDPPVIGTAGPYLTATDAKVTFTTSAYDGGEPITSYTVAASPGNIAGICFTSLQYCTVSGLTPGSAYTFAVTAHNLVGASSASSGSNSFTPSNGQTITWVAVPASIKVAATGTVSATGGLSGNSVVFSSLTPSVCTTKDDVVTGVAVGSCTVAADQAAGSIYGAATQVTAIITITKGTQTLTFGAQPTLSVRTTPYALNPAASASSGLNISYASSTPTICSIASGDVTALKPGMCIISADQAGDANYNAATQVKQTFEIIKGNQTITFAAQAAQTYSTTAFALNPLPTASSNLALTYATTTPIICSVDATGKVTAKQPGTCSVVASQPGNASYNPATSVTQSIVIDKITQTITFAKQTDRAFSTKPVSLKPLATATSKLAVTYSSLTPSICSVSGSDVTSLTAGVCVVAADQTGDTFYAAAPQVSLDIVIAKVKQTITFDKQTAQVIGETSYPVNPLATASSGLAVTYTSTTPGLCTVSGTSITVLSAGTCTLAANQAGDATYLAADQVTQNIEFKKAAQTITFPAQSAQVIGVGTFILNPGVTASSGLNVSIVSATPNVCAITSAWVAGAVGVKALAVGTCTLTASQAGDTLYDAAADVSMDITINDAAAPDAPVLNSATPGFASATLDFSPPASDGGSPITGYLALCTAVNQPALSGAGAADASKIVVGGMLPGETYTCSVTAQTSVGSSVASNALPVKVSDAYQVPIATSPLTGLWWNEQESGWGISIVQHNGMAFAAWYSYGATGLPTWYVIPNCPVVGNACSGEMYAVSGGSSMVKPWDGTNKVVTPIGNGILTFSNADTGTFNYTINGLSGQKAITRQVFATGQQPSPTDFSDLWWNANESGWGVALSHQYNTIFAVVFGFDANGSPVWYVASDCQVVGNYCSGNLYHVSGGSMPTQFWNGNNLQINNVGVIEFQFADANFGTMNFFINGASGSKTITRQSF